MSRRATRLGVDPACNLAFHAGRPLARALASAASIEVDLLTPRIGERVAAGQPFLSSRW